MERSLYTRLSSLRDTHWWFTGRVKIVKDLLLLYIGRGNSILDVGSGAGAMLSMLNTFGDVSALEPDAEMAQALRDEFNSTRVIEGTLGGDVITGPYDVITLFDVLEHIEDDEGTLKRAHDLLETGGHIVLTVPAYQFLWSRQDRESHHKRRYTERALMAKVEAAGFKIERTTYFNTFLFPIALATRMVQKMIKRENGSDLETGTRANGLLRMIFSSERFLLRFFDFPFGLSIFCLAKKIRHKKEDVQRHNW